LPKAARYSLGLKIDSLFLETIECILISVNSNGNIKLSCLCKASSKLDLLKFFLQMAWEVKAISNNKFLLLSENLVEIGKMLGGWLRRTQ